MSVRMAQQFRNESAGEPDFLFHLGADFIYTTELE